MQSRICAFDAFLCPDDNVNAALFPFSVKLIFCRFVSSFALGSTTSCSCPIEAALLKCLVRDLMRKGRMKKERR